MAYEWDEGRARRVRLIKIASMWALTASALGALLLTAAPAAGRRPIPFKVQKASPHEIVALERISSRQDLGST